MRPTRWVTSLVLALVVAGAPGPAAAVRSEVAEVAGVAGVAGVAAPAAGTTRWVRVPVATLWTRPGAARPVDAPALAAQADVGLWLARMTLAQRRALNGRVETQALYGDQVRVLRTSGTWSRVTVVGQPTPRLATGYPGWLPTSQLTPRAPVSAPRWATVTSPTVPLFKDAALARAGMRVSYGTRLPVASVAPDAVEVVLLNGERRFLPPGSARLEGAELPVPARGQDLVAEARRFLGLAYLWGGTSGFGFDCSGLTHAVHRQLGVTIPRDATPQYAGGLAVARADLRPGDLVFFRNATGIHHVGMYVGRGRMIHSPRTGSTVRLASLAAQPWAGQFAGGRRYIP